MSIWFRLQVNKNQNGLYSACYQMLRNSLEAEEVVQDTFIKLWQAKENGAKQTKAWMYQVARNQCLDIIRRRQYEVKYQQHSLLDEKIGKSACDELINNPIGPHQFSRTHLCVITVIELFLTSLTAPKLLPGTKGHFCFN